ncbi:ABC transporter ATP-binding protein [Gordonia sp. (in: high G+C Gram-positive bacteria)]|uniref:ABC transporter ATP-binding protein n=1 Tax=Gordonia sp. (in: high G+C Gram-positive bacteria) TaxID=84139 RepID=UPI003C744E72
MPQPFLPGSEPSPQPGSDNAALQVSGLVKKFGDKTAVNNLDLLLPRGELLALLGPNGAGKTTTVEICEGFTKPDAGTVRVLGLDPINDNDALRARIGVMLQGGGAYPGAKAAEMLRLCASYSANPLDPEWLLTVLGLNDVASTSFRRLSGGQQQRLSLACALVGRPELVFLDEPTAGLDAHARIMVWELISRLRADGVSILLTTHLLDEAEELADQIVIIDSGRVVAAGTPAELVRHDAEGQLRFTVGGTGAADITTSALQEVLPAGCHATISPTGEHLVVGDITPETIEQIARLCTARGALIESLNVASNSLQDVFLNLTGREVRA